jgi:hypothetical protein
MWKRLVFALMTVPPCLALFAAGVAGMWASFETNGGQGGLLCVGGFFGTLLGGFGMALGATPAVVGLHKWATGQEW